MGERKQKRSARARSLAWPLPALAAIALFLLAVPAAQADYEQVPEHFGVNSEEAEHGPRSAEAEQLDYAVGMAVNERGEGGVPAGSLYVVGKNARVVRFAPGSEGEEPEFQEAWGWGIAQGGPANAYVRCGPAYEGVAEAAEGTYEHCKPVHSGGFGGEETGHFAQLGAVAVNQSNGYVYVRNTSDGSGLSDEPPRLHNLIEVFTATGTPVGEGFGDQADTPFTEPETIADSPEKIHEDRSPAYMGIAVDDAGTVYLGDADVNTPYLPETRIMSFEPCTPGDYENYCYAGQGDDIATQVFAARMALVGGDRLVTANEEVLREYPLEGGEPAPICAMSVSGQLLAMAVNPLTGEIFYYTFSGRRIHRLGACDPESGEFGEEIQHTTPTPRPPQAIYALAIDLTHSWGPLRPPGVLYAADYVAGIGDVFAPAKVSPPEVLAESTANATTTSATLRAQIDPQGSLTSYRFEYLSEAEYLANGESFDGPDAPRRAPAADGQIASGEVATVAAAVSGLAPDTAYRFRALASSHCEPSLPEFLCEGTGEAASFSTYPPALAVPPDGRAYELVSPAQKHGGEVFPAEPSLSSCADVYGLPLNGECKPPGTSNPAFPMQSAPGGDSVAYAGYAFSPGEGAAVFNSYLSRRTAGGWQTTAMSPALLGAKEGRHLAYDAGLGEGTIYQGDPQLSAGAPAGQANVYLLDTSEPGALRPLVAAPFPNRTPGTVEYAGHSGDFAAQLFAANDALTGETAYAPEPPDPGFSGRDLYEWRDGALSLVNVAPGNAEVLAEAKFATKSPDAHGVSDDGSRVFFEAGGQLYVREEGRQTIQLAHAGAFLAASKDGSQVLFEDGCLYDLATEACTDLTAGEGGFEGVSGSATDLSHVYFIDSAILPDSGANERGAEAQAGEHNLYLHEAGSGTSFIATLASADNTGTGGAYTLQDWNASPGGRTAEASPSGRYLAFGSTAALTGYGNVGPCGTKEELGEYVIVHIPCPEAFLYDSATGRLSCASCNPTGEAPRGPTYLRRLGGRADWQPQPRYVTDSGRLFFDSQDRLSPRDTNGKVEDVYEYEPQGLGSCGRARGCVALISPGTGTVDSNFLSIGESGSDVFFTSRERLVAKDSDELIDLYDAREGGGFASESETTRPECQGEACQPSPAPPSELTPASAAFAGAGNLSEPSTGASRCRASGRKAQRLSRRAKKLRRGARRIARRNPGRARALRRKATRMARQAKRQSRQARRCRARTRTSRRTNR